MSVFKGKDKKVWMNDLKRPRNSGFSRRTQTDTHQEATAESSLQWPNCWILEDKNANAANTAVSPKISGIANRSPSLAANLSSPSLPIVIPKDVVPVFTNRATSLSELLAFDQKSKPDATVPLIVSKCCVRLFDNGLSTEGIFRVPGNSTRMTKVENEFNRGAGADCDFKKLGVSVEDAASLLKKFLRESLNDFLFPASMAPEFEALRDISEPSERNPAFLALWEKLPPINRAVLSELLELLTNVAANSFLNLMNIDNLGTVFGGMADIPMQNGKWMMCYLLEEYEQLFGSPALLNTHTPVLRRKLINHMRSIFTLAYVKDKYVISADSGGCVNVWDSETFTHIKKLSSGLKCYVPQLFVQIDSSMIHQLWTLYPDSIRIWDVESILSPSIKKIEDTPSNVINIPNTCVCAQVGEHVWVAGEKVVILDAITHAVVKELVEYSDSITHSMGYAGGFIWIWRGKTVHIWDPESFTLVREIVIDGVQSPKTTRYFERDGDVWLTTESGAIIVISLDKFEIKTTLTGHTAAVYHLQSVGPLIWSCSWDTSICWWQTNPPQLLTKMPNKHTDAVSFLLPIWRESLNGWDVWSASWDRSCQITFVPKDYHLHIASSAPAPSPRPTPPTPMTSISSPQVLTPINMPPSTMLPQVPLPKVQSSPGFQLPPALSAPPAAAAKWSRPTPGSKSPSGLSSPANELTNLATLELQLERLEAQLSTMVAQNERELESRMASWTNPPSPAAINDLKTWIRVANESEVELQLQIEETRLRIRGEHHSRRYSTIYEKLGLVAPN